MIQRPTMIPHALRRVDPTTLIHRSCGAASRRLNSMTPEDSTRRQRIAWMFFATAALSAALSVWAWLTGGFRAHVVGIPVSVRGADRAAVVALALAVIGLCLHDTLRRCFWQVVREERRSYLLPASAAIAAIGLLVLALVFGVRVVGGADSYGYVSQAELWRKGDLRIHQQFALSMPWPNAESSFAPLGYRPAENQTLVPIYPPGLPLLMAAFALVFGRDGVYYVSYLSGAALVVLTYVLGRCLSTRLAGALAALTVAFSPVVLMMTLSVMSDIPAAALWLGSLALACRATPAASAGAGILAGLAVLVRPNLAPLMIIPVAVLLAEHGQQDPRSRRTQVAVYGLALAPFLFFMAWLFNNLYGSPLISGYDTQGMFAWRHVVMNLQRYPRWLWESQGPLVFLFLLAPMWIRRRQADSKLRAALLGFVALIWVSYLLYLPYDAWWFTRFLLPAIPVMLILSIDTLMRLTARWTKHTQVAAMLLFGFVTVACGIASSYRHRLLQVAVSEQRYADVGRYIAEELPHNAVVYSWQHSGSVRYYSGRLTIRYDAIEPEWFDRSISHLQQSGYEPFLVVDEWELPAVRARFASQEKAVVIADDPPPSTCSHPTFVYRLVPRRGTPTSTRVPRVSGCG